MKVYFTPKTLPGKFSVWSVAVFILCFAAFWVAVSLGERGGDNFFDNLVLTIPMLLAAIAGVTSFFSGLVGIAGYRERAILVYLSMVIGLCVLLFIIGEIAFPH